MNLTRVTLATASSVLLLATLAACAGDSTDTDTDSSTEQGEPVAQFGRAGGMPGASGEVAAVSGSTAQVQNPQTGQVAVTWTADTTFTEEVDGSLDDVAEGSCVMVTTDGETSAETTGIAAATVRVTEANDDGGCGFGAGGPGRTGERPEGAPTDLPSDLPEGMPSGPPDVQRPGGFGTIGEVTAASAEGFTVSSMTPGSDETTEVTVAVDDATTYTTTAPAKASAVAVGRCVTARGESDDTGAVTADTISVSDPVDGECTGGFLVGMRGPGGDGA